MNYNFIDLTGQVFGRLTVIRFNSYDKFYHSLWLCKCNCGKEKIISGNNLQKQTKSCGCILKEILSKRRKLNLEGQTYGKLIVIRQAPVDKLNRTYWLCKCSCGKFVTILGARLHSGHTKSCGCIKKDVAKHGKDSHKWMGGRLITKNGYVKIHKPEHLNADVKGYVLEHVYVMSQILGRVLEKGETVHHKNGIKNDNVPENLELWAHSHSDGQRVIDLINWAKEILKKYSSYAESGIAH